MPPLKGYQDSLAAFAVGLGRRTKHDKVSWGLRCFYSVLPLLYLSSQQLAARWIGGKKRCWNSNVNWIGRQWHKNFIQISWVTNCSFDFLPPLFKRLHPLPFAKHNWLSPRLLLSVSIPRAFSSSPGSYYMGTERGSSLLSTWVHTLRTGIATKHVYLQRCSVNILLAALAWVVSLAWPSQISALGFSFSHEQLKTGLLCWDYEVSQGSNLLPLHH